MLWLWITLSMLGAVMTTSGKAATFESVDIEGFTVEEVHLRTLDGVHVAAWYLPVESDRAVVLLPGIGGNRNHMRSRAAYYARNGVASIMPDFRGTGQSEAAVVSMGWHERYDVEAAYRYLLARGYAHVGAHGISMGAAAVCYAMQEVDDFAWVVLESSYDTIDNALANRLAIAGVPMLVAAPLRVFSAWRMAAGPRQLRPVDYIARCTAPTLIVAGDSEAELRVEETEAIYAASGAASKTLHFFAGAGHNNFHGRYTEEYVQVVGTFLQEHAIIAGAPVH